MRYQRWFFSLLTLMTPTAPKTSTTPSSWKRSTLLKHQIIPSYLPLTRFNDLLLRCRELDTWTQDLTLPAVVWLSGFFNPQSFLTGMAGGKGWGWGGRVSLLAEVLPGLIPVTPPCPSPPVFEQSFQSRGGNEGSRKERSPQLSVSIAAGAGYVPEKSHCHCHTEGAQATQKQMAVCCSRISSAVTTEGKLVLQTC